MPNSVASQFEVPSGTDDGFENEKEQTPVSPPTSSLSSLSTLAELPGYSTILDLNSLGEHLGRLFSEHPDLPGVILLDQNHFAGVISQTHFYKCISRAFGREIYYRRPAAIMLAEMKDQPLILSADCLIPVAVEQCLTRPSDSIYEPFLVYTPDSEKYRLCDVQILLLASSQIAALRNRQMEQILNSVTDGLLVIDRDFRIGGEYSKVLGKIFERDDLKDLPLPEVLEPLLDSTTHEQLHDYLKILFNPKLIDRLIKPINPVKQVSARFPSTDTDREQRTKHFAINFERIRTQAEITQVLVRIEDITQQINLAIELAHQEAAAEEKLHLVMQVLQVEPSALNRFTLRLHEEIAAMDQLLALKNGSQNPRETVHALFRKAHTLKGEASLLRLTAHERKLHQLEDKLEPMRSAPQLKTDDLAALKPSLKALQRLAEQINQALEQLKSFAPSTQNQANALPSTHPTVETGLMEKLARFIADLTERLHKPVVFHTTVTDAVLPEAHMEILYDSLIHLARNSMVHGIESAEERATRGKNPTGIIQLELRSHPDCDEIIFQDDGAGLNYDKIRRRVLRLGWVIESDDELRQAIFEPGFSTADSVTELAGRGVGLDAIRSALQKVGGRIIPHSEPGAYCAFQILLPKVPPSLHV
ncbi:MAG: Hpt domain-containing protein [Methylacidiphilales bacterium]|nr:Hpt domain-containing protein [Candidatus Methylacidiphilales bacterium]